MFSKMSSEIKGLNSRLDSPTPSKWRRLGNALLGASTMVTGMAIVGDEKWIAELALFTGVIGKFLTDFFVEEVVTIQKKQKDE